MLCVQIECILVVHYIITFMRVSERKRERAPIKSNGLTHLHNATWQPCPCPCLSFTHPSCHQPLATAAYNFKLRMEIWLRHRQGGGGAAGSWACKGGVASANCKWRVARALFICVLSWHRDASPCRRMMMILIREAQRKLRIRRVVRTAWSQQH